MKYCKNIFVTFLLFPTVNLAEEVVFPVSATRMALIELEMERRGMEYERPVVPLPKRIEEEVVVLEEPPPPVIKPEEVIPEIVEEDQKVFQEDTERAEFKQDLNAFYELIVERTADEKKIDEDYRYLRSKWKQNSYYVRAVDQAYTTYLLIEVTKGQ